MEDIDVIDVEHYHDTSDKVFSHPSLVMSSIRKCLELGSKEMREGWFNEKTDRNGFLIRTYIEDTRKAFIAAVKMTIELMQPDMDKEAKDNIDSLRKAIKTKFDELDNEEEEEFQELNPMLKMDRIKKGIYPAKGYLNKELPYYNIFIDYETDKYREIFGELNKLTQRLDYYKGEDIEA